jgi:hypothetical protein
MKVGPRECRDFWKGILFDFPARRKRLVYQWFEQSMQENTKLNSLNEHIRSFIENLLFNPFHFEMHHDYCSLINGYRIPYQMLNDSERAFLVECFDQRDSLWKKSAEGKNGEFSLVAFSFNDSIRKWDTKHVIDNTWQRTMVRDFCWMLDEKYQMELLVGVQMLLKNKHDCFLLGILESLQRGNLYQLQCWGYHWFDKHPEEL